MALLRFQDFKLIPSPVLDLCFPDLTGAIYHQLFRASEVLTAELGFLRLPNYKTWSSSLQHISIHFSIRLIGTIAISYIHIYVYTQTYVTIASWCDLTGLHTHSPGQTFERRPWDRSLCSRWTPGRAARHVLIQSGQVYWRCLDKLLAKILYHKVCKSKNHLKVRKKKNVKSSMWDEDVLHSYSTYVGMSLVSWRNIWLQQLGPLDTQWPCFYIHGHNRLGTLQSCLRDLVSGLICSKASTSWLIYLFIQGRIISYDPS